MKARTSLSHWIDESTPERVRDVLRKVNVDPVAFEMRIGPLLGIYRSSEHVKRAMPTPGAEAEYVGQMAEQLSATCALLGRNRVPPRTHASLLNVMLARLGEDWNALRDRVLRDLILVQSVLPIVDQGLRAKPAKRGAKPKAARAELLAAIIAELESQMGPRKGAARLALEVLRAYGIAGPSPDQKEDAYKGAKRAARVKGRK